MFEEANYFLAALNNHQVSVIYIPVIWSVTYRWIKPFVITNATLGILKTEMHLHIMEVPERATCIINNASSYLNYIEHTEWE